MPTAASMQRDPASEDFSRYLDSANPFKDQFTGLYPSYPDVVNGTNWRNGQVRRRLSATPLGVAPVAPAANPSAGYSVLRKTKNPALQSLFDANLARIQKNQVANNNDFDQYFRNVQSNNAANAGDLQQEGDFINGAFNGDLEGALAGVRTRYADAARATNANAATSFQHLLDDYKSGANTGIDALQTGLATQRGKFESRTAGEITGEEAARAGMRGRFAAAGRRATDLAIADADRSNKALFAQSGGAGSSYFGRLAIGARNHAEAQLATALADRERDDYGLTRSERAALTDKTGALERGEITGAGEARLRLNDVVAGRARDDAGYLLSRDEKLNSDIASQERGDISYVRDAAGRLVGVRRKLRTDAANDALAPISVRQSMASADLRDASQLGAIDLANNFYGLDDGGAYGPGGVPRITPLRGGYGRGGGGGGGGDYFDVDSRVSPVPQRTQEALPTVLPQRGASIHANRSGAERAYFNSAGVYPDQDPNFSPRLWQWARSQVQSDTTIRPSRYAPLSYRDDFGSPASIPLGPEVDGDFNNYFAV